MNKPKIAICYDFDMTLSPKYMQEFGFMDDLNCAPQKFWRDQDVIIDKYKSDKMLVNMYATVYEAKKKGILLSKQKFMDYGKTVELYRGVETWFERINSYGEELGVEVEHYILSSGIKEIVEGTSIAKYFKKIYACSYIYDENGEPIWPSLSINYTNKTQFLYRINKGILDETDDSINEMMDHEHRLVPFENMIYIGDSETDIPCMRLVMKNGGKAIGVYNESEKQKEYLKSLLANNRINYMARADYSKGETLETIVKAIIKSDKSNFNLKQLSKAQKDS